MTSTTADLAAAIRTVAEPPRTPPAPPPGVSQAAVLIVANTSEPGVPVLFVVRSDRVSTHQSQIAFPGGRVEHGEDPPTAALREAQEEVALPPGNVEVIGTLPPFLTAVSNRWLTPVLGISETPWEIVSDGFEVAEWFWAPLDELASGPHYTRMFERDGVARDVHFYQFGKHNIWGVTGAIVHELLTRLGS